MGKFTFKSKTICTELILMKSQTKSMSQCINPHITLMSLSQRKKHLLRWRMRSYLVTLKENLVSQMMTKMNQRMNMKKFLVNSHRMQLKIQRKEITEQRLKRGKLIIGHQKKATHLRTLKQGRLNTFLGVKNMMKVQTRMIGTTLYQQTLRVRRNQCSQIIMMVISITKASLSMSMLMRLYGKMKKIPNMEKNLWKRKQHSQKKKNHQMKRKRRKKKLCQLKIKRRKMNKMMRYKLYIQLLSLRLQKLKRLKKKLSSQKMFQLILDKMLVFGIQTVIAYRQQMLKQSLITSG